MILLIDTLIFFEYITNSIPKLNTFFYNIESLYLPYIFSLNVQLTINVTLLLMTTLSLT